MSSLEETLAQANLNMAQATGALNDVGARIDAIQAAGIAAVTSLAASMRRTLNLDPTGGDDTADGSATAPLRTLTEVQRRTPACSIVYVDLHGDLIFTEDVAIYSTMILRPAAGVFKPRIAPSNGYLHDSGEVLSHGFHIRAGGNVIAEGMRIGLAQWSGGGIVRPGASLFKNYGSSFFSGTHIGLVQCEFDPGASPVGAVTGLPLANLRVSLPVEVSSMLGRWSHHATSTDGIDSLLVRQLDTNLPLL